MGILWLSGAPALGPVPAGLPTLKIGLPSAGFLLQAFQPALILALLGSVDSLLTSLVADSLTGTRHNPDRELVGQGIGNMISGSARRPAGRGRHDGNGREHPRRRLDTRVRRSAGALPPAPRPGPRAAGGTGSHAVLAAIMMKVGWDIIDWPLLARIHRIRREHLFVMLLTLGLTVFVDLVTAVAWV